MLLYDKHLEDLKAVWIATYAAAMVLSFLGIGLVGVSIATLLLLTSPLVIITLLVFKRSYLAQRWAAVKKELYD